MWYKIAVGIIFGLLLICIIGVFCIVIIKLYIRKIKKYNAVIYENEIAFQKTLNNSIIETQEQLLNSLSKDLHDDAGQQLSVINFQIENLKLDHPDCKHDLIAISDSVRTLSQSLRQLSHALNGNRLAQNGLLKAIKNDIERLRKNKQFEVNLKTDDKTQKFKSDEQIVIYRIFQEVTNNILKHSKATKIDITIYTAPVFKIIIQDNGIGFDPNKISGKINSIGIQNCSNRAKMIDYHFQIQSQPKNGTTIILRENK